MEKKLTETDVMNLENLPEGLFDAIDVWPAVKRTDYSLGRLVTAGYVKKHILTEKSKSGAEFYHVKYEKIKTYKP